MPGGLPRRGDVQLTEALPDDGGILRRAVCGRQTVLGVPGIKWNTATRDVRETALSCRCPSFSERSRKIHTGNHTAVVVRLLRFGFVQGALFRDLRRKALGSQLSGKAFRISNRLKMIHKQPVHFVPRNDHESAKLHLFLSLKFVVPNSIKKPAERAVL